jgi:adenosylhomocysteinase
VIITHVLDTAVPYIEALSQAVSLDAIIGIPYSTMTSALQTLENRGDRVVIAEDIESLPGLARKEIEQVSDARHSPVVVQEIGGYCAHFIDALSASGHLAGVVEDTKQGHWKYESQTQLPCPVLSIADSPLKALENQQVGKAISHALETLLRRRFHRLLTETRVGVLGYGGIGEASARALASLGARVSVHDICDIRMAKAAMDGFADASRQDLIQRSDLLLGVSGNCSIGAEDLMQAPANCIIASGSSKQIEIEIAALEGHSYMDIDSGLVRRFNIAGKDLFLLNQGMPVNFLEQSILGRVLDLVYTELYMCIREIALENAEPGLGSLTTAQQRDIAQCWYRAHWATA